jgi:hypothetical protein
LEQRYAVKAGDGAADNYEAIQKAFDNDILSRAQIF